MMPEKRWYAESLLNAWRQAEKLEKTQLKSVEDTKMSKEKPMNRPKALQDLIFSGFDQIAIPNIYTFKPKNGEKQINMHDMAWYRNQLDKNGHIILKNTSVTCAKEFNEWGKLFMTTRANYEGGQNPRQDLGDGILNVNTAEPPQISLAFHNEKTYHNTFPSKIVFCCFNKGESGGITTLLDNVKMSRAMPAHITDKFKKVGVKYILNMQNAEAFKDGREPLWYN